MSDDFFTKYTEKLTYRVENLANCESEPITKCGATQAGGYFIACHPTGLDVIAASENWADLLGRPLDKILGQPLSDVLKLKNGSLIDEAFVKSSQQRPFSEVEVPGTSHAHFFANFHRSSHHICIDVEDGALAGSYSGYPANELKSLVSDIQSSDDINAIAMDAARRFRAFTGFDRVMIYKFHEQWDGEVIGESVREGLEPFLGLRYPASDIPAQARKLFYDLRFRMIFDSHAEAVSVFTVPGIARQELDLSCSGLRASSPIHIKYLQNMGVVCSFSVSIKLGPKLWGLISCHHYEKPIHLPREIRSACELSSQILSARITELVTKRRLHAKNRTLLLTQQLLNSVAAGRSPIEAFKDNEKAILELMNSSGAFVRLHGATLELGECPSRTVIDKTFAEIAKNDALTVWKSDHLRDALQISETPNEAAGAFAIPFSMAFEDGLVWFRKEVVQEVRWGGKPTDRNSFFEPKTTLEPRASFKEWSEIVKDRSAPWTEEDEECAQYLLFNFVQGIFGKAAALARAFQELELAAKAKDEFIGLVSHELRTPLGIILGWIDIIKDIPSLDTEVLDAIRIIDRNAKIQIGLINDLLDISRIISGKLSLDPLPNLNVTQLLSEVIEGLTPTANAKSISLVWNHLDKVSVTADADRLRQIVWNLLTNAIKFTPKNGRVEVELDKYQSMYVIRIRDSGVGLEPTELNSIFERFVQVGTHKARQAGLGLGLSIVRALTELHGGTVKAESEGLGKGTTFIVSLPIFAINESEVESETPPQIALPATQEFRGLKILIAEDQEDSGRALRIVIERFGGDVTLVENGALALQAATQKKYDLILSDVGMPEMNGYEFMQAWRKLEADRRVPLVPAIALTAYARPKDRAEALEAGFQNHIAKPVDRTELIAVIRSVLRNR